MNKNINDLQRENERLRQTHVMVEKRCAQILMMGNKGFPTNKFASYDLAQDVTNLVRRDFA